MIKFPSFNALKEGNLIKDGYHAKLDEYRDASKNGKDWIARLEQQEREYTGIRSLKAGVDVAVCDPSGEPLEVVYFLQPFAQIFPLKQMGDQRFNDFLALFDLSLSDQRPVDPLL